MSISLIQTAGVLTGNDWKPIGPGTAGHAAILKADVVWNVHHMEKLIVPLPLQ